MTNSSARAYNITRAIVGAYFAGLLLELIAVGIWMTRANRDWGLPEWLINYQGGMIRRGLPGSIFRILTHVTHIPSIYMAAAAGIACYCVIFLVTWRLVSLSRWRWWAIALVTGPTTLAFPVVARTSFRKDILYFATLALLIDWLRRRPEDSPLRRPDVLLSVVLSLVLPALVLSQEPVFVYFPYLLAAMLLCMRPWSRVLKVCLVPALLSIIALAVVAKHTGTYDQMQQICASIGKPVVATCPEGIQIEGVPDQPLSLFIREYHFWRHYPLDFLLGMIPVVGAWFAFRREENTRRRFLVLLSMAALAALGSLGVFYMGLDWGRWINLHTNSMMLLVLLVESQRTEEQPESEVAAHWPGLQPAMVLFLLVYATCWSMPGLKDKPLFGYLSLASRLLHWHGSFTS